MEQSYFVRWWRLQPLPTRDLVRLLVRTEQLSFANGGWCMHDEATPHYVDMIDQMTLGSALLSPHTPLLAFSALRTHRRSRHTFLHQQLGFVPTVGWQIDAFGHTSTNAALHAAMGFDAFFFMRLDHNIAQRRRQQHDIEWLWAPLRSNPNITIMAGFFADDNAFVAMSSVLACDWN